MLRIEMMVVICQKNTSTFLANDVETLETLGHKCNSVRLAIFWPQSVSEE